MSTTQSSTTPREDLKKLLEHYEGALEKMTEAIKMSMSMLKQKDHPFAPAAAMVADDANDAMRRLESVVAELQKMSELPPDYEETYKSVRESRKRLKKMMENATQQEKEQDKSKREDKEQDKSKHQEKEQDKTKDPPHKKSKCNCLNCVLRNAGEELFRDVEKGGSGVKVYTVTSEGLVVNEEKTRKMMSEMESKKASSSSTTSEKKENGKEEDKKQEEKENVIDCTE